MLRFLLYTQAIAILVKLSHTVTLRVTHPIAKHRGLRLILSRRDSFTQELRETVAMKNIVAEHQAARIVTDKLLTDDKSLSEAVRRRLDGILEPHPIITSVAKQTLEPRQIMWRRDNQYLTDPGEHQGRNRIINHGLIKHGKHLLAHPLGDRIQTSAASAGQYNTFHI